MRDVNRIPVLLKEIEKLWKENPDYRLGQLITCAAMPSSPHPTTFHIEDDELLEGLKTFKERKSVDDSLAPIWMKHSVIGRANPESLTVHHIKELITDLVDRNQQIIISPESILEVIGAPVSDKNWMNNQKLRLDKLKEILTVLEEEQMLRPVQIGYRVNEQ